MESASHGNIKDQSKQELLVVIYFSFDKPQTIVVYITDIRKTDRKTDRQTDGLYINNLDEVIRLAENLKRVQHLNLIRRPRVKTLNSYLQ